MTKLNDDLRAVATHKSWCAERTDPEGYCNCDGRVERLLDLLERAHDVIHRVGEESVKTHNAITEELEGKR